MYSSKTAGVAVVAAWGQFRNPNDGEHLPLVAWQLLPSDDSEEVTVDTSVTENCES
jgi:hypothetical protein